MIESRVLQCSVFIAASLDGFIAWSDGRIDWLSIVDRSGEDYGYQAFHDSIDMFIVGRKTYERALSFDAWPYEGAGPTLRSNRVALGMLGIPRSGFQVMVDRQELSRNFGTWWCRERTVRCLGW